MKIVNKLQQIIHFKGPLIILSPQNGICNCSVNLVFYIDPCVPCDFIFSASDLSNTWKAIQSETKSSSWQSVIRSASLFSGYIYFLLYSVCTRVPAIARREWAFFSVHVLIPAAPFSFNTTFFWSPKGFWQTGHYIFLFHFSIYTLFDWHCWKIQSLQSTS